MVVIAVLIQLFALASLVSAAASDAARSRRWGQAVALVKDTLYVFGGKTDFYNELGYTSARNTDDLLYLSLSDTFDPANPPWDYVGGARNSCTTNGPLVAWHTLSAFETSRLLLFGGTPPADSSISATGSDSAAVLDVYNRVEPAWTCEDQKWSSEPERRIHHTATTMNGKVYIIGGERVDASSMLFSDHSVFNPSQPGFTSLTGDGGPGSISGHASVVLPDGRILVFGGTSGSSLNPFSTIWILDTSKDNAAWTTANVNPANLPTPRRGFAATVIDDHRVLIQGGANAYQQTVYGDGWILDTSSDPWTWTRIDALSQVGQRRDHFAVTYGNSVVLGFGYGPNGPADASLFVYDVPSTTSTSAYQPPATPTFYTTLPPPTNTGAGQSSTYPSGGAGNGSGSMSETGANGSSNGMPAPTGSGSNGLPTATGGAGNGHGNGNGNGNGGGSGSDPNGSAASDSTKQRKLAAIILGTIFGVLALIVVCALGVRYYRRRQEYRERFMFLNDDDFDDDAQLIGSAAPATREQARANMAEAGGAQGGLIASLAGLVGLGAAAARNPRDRRDMLADEDASQYDFGYNPYYGVRREGSGSTGTSGRYSTGRRRERPTFGALMQGSLASLRSVTGAMLGVATARAHRSREASYRSEKFDEKDPFADDAALIVAEDQPPQRPRGGRQISSTSSKWSYNDPFMDPMRSEADLGHSQDGFGYYTGLPPPPSIQKDMPGGVGIETTWLSPVSEHPSNSESSNPSGSVSSHDIGGLSSMSHDTSRSPHRPTSILDANQSPSLPIKRSDSWWARFSSRSFLDRRSSDGSRFQPPQRQHRGFVEFRDPTPAPRLEPVKEGSGSQQQSPESAHGSSAALSSVYGTTGHRKSATSLQTADSQLADRVGDSMVVVQHGNAGSSHSRMTSGASANVDTFPPEWRTAPRPLSVVISSGSHDRNSSERATIESHSPVEMTDTESLAAPSLERETPAASTPSLPSSSSSSSAPSGRRPISSPAVAARIRAFEHQAMAEAEAARSPTSPPAGERNTRKIEHRSGPRPPINYGLAQRPSLYVANPDATGSFNSRHSATPP